ncbi:hypothetical protein O0L34_g4179 [Tuta absoluta]|nr:hypothetical protein O0L34_g4179 [Tuta absoluta]
MDFEDILREIDHYDEIFWPNIYRIPKTYIRDVKNPFELEPEMFQKRYRFYQDSVLYIQSLIKSDLEKMDMRGLPIAPEFAVLLTLRFYATASFQIVCGDLFEISQPTASNIITKVSKLLAQLHKQFIKFSRGQEATINRHLQRIGKMWAMAWITRKSDFSINVQVVVGPRMEILDIVAKWAGSTHDSRIFQVSSVFMKYTQGILTGRLVGDNGYPTLPFVLTPLRPPPQDPPSMRYNRAQIKTRNIVERTFGIWKRRFPCLKRGLGNKLTTVSNIIVACGVLHNLTLILNDVMAFPDEDNNEGPHNEPSVVPSTSAGFLLRRTLIENNYQ